MVPKSRSGTTWGDAQYAAKGYGRITLRLPLDALAMLADIAHETGETRAQVVDRLIRGAPTTGDEENSVITRTRASVRIKGV